MSATTIAAVPFRPSSVAVISPLRLVVCSNTVLTRVDLSSSLFVATGPMILGIGHVPADRIFSGYADTTGDPGYFYQVKHAPFGGTLSLMVNHDHAFADGGRYYRIEVDGVAQTLSWNDYKWSTTTNRFELVSTSASFGSFFRVRQPQELWYNHWLGYRLDTSPLTNALHTITLKLYSAASLASLMSTHTLHVRIDNQWPTASIDAIFHDGAPVGTCGIVTSGSDRFVFRITANDPQGHLKSWALTAMWGDNHSAAVASASYVPPAPPAPPIWAGPVGATVPAAPGWPATVAGDPTSTRCAHTFYLGVWDRVIDGYDHLHYSAYHKSITIML